MGIFGHWLLWIQFSSRGWCPPSAASSFVEVYQHFQRIIPILASIRWVDEKIPELDFPCAVYCFRAIAPRWSCCLSFMEFHPEGCGSDSVGLWPTCASESSMLVAKSPSWNCLGLLFGLWWKKIKVQVPTRLARFAWSYHEFVGRTKQMT